MRVFAADGIKAVPGDLMCFRTGFDEMIFEGKKQPDGQEAAQPMRGLDGSDRSSCSG